MTGSPANGTITFAPVDTNGRPISYKLANGGQASSQPVSAAVTNGVFSIQLPDTSQTVPTNVCFQATLRLATGGGFGPGYSCVQPAATNYWCTASACNFDNFNPNLTALPIAGFVATINGAAGSFTFTGPDASCTATTCTIGSNVRSIANGGTGATTASAALANLGGVANTNAAVVGALGYTPVNKAGDTMTGALKQTGTNLTPAFWPGPTTTGTGGEPSFHPDASNPVGPGIFGQSVIINSDGSCDDWWYLGSGVKHAVATDPYCRVWGTAVSATGIGTLGYYTDVFQDPATPTIWYLAISGSPDGTGHWPIYLYSSTDKNTWTIANGGNPILTPSATGTDYYYSLFNPSIMVIGSTWYMANDAGTSTGFSGYTLMASATGCPSSCNFNLNISASTINVTQGNPDLVYVPDRNAVMLFQSPSLWGVIVTTASTSSNLLLPASWTTQPCFNLWYPNVNGPSDPTVYWSPTRGMKGFEGLLSYSNYQTEGDQAYTNLTMDQFYDAVTHCQGPNAIVSSFANQTGTGNIVAATAPTISAPVINGNITGTYNLSGTPSIVSPIAGATGITATPGYEIKSSYFFNALSGTAQGLVGVGQLQGLSGNSTATVIGLEGDGITSDSGHTLGTAVGVKGYIDINGSSVLANGYTLYAAPPSGSPGTVTNQYGLYIDDQRGTGGTMATNHWGIYQAGAFDVNQFAGALQAIGTTNVAGCALTSPVGGTWAGQFASGTAGTCTVTVTPGITAAHGFFCSANDLTTTADKVIQTASTTTTCTISGTTASGDVVNWAAIAY